MPESRSRKQAKSDKSKAASSTAPGGPRPQRAKGGGRWVAPTMVTLLVVGLLWIVVFYLAGSQIPVMSDLGYWNLGIGMGLILLGLITAMKWE